MEPHSVQPLDYRAAQPRFRLLKRLAVPILVIVAIVGSWYGASRYREVRGQRAVTVVEQNGGVISRDKQGVIERVYLASPAVGDEALVQIAPHLRYLPGLKELDLVGRRITDEGLRSLTGIDHVKDLYIFETSASAAAITELKQRFPHVKVHEVAPNPPASKLASLNVYPHAVTALALLPDGDLLTGSGDGFVRRWTADSNHPSREIHAHADWLFSISISPDGKTLATGGGDNLVRLWDLATMRETARLSGHTDDVHAVAFHPDGTSLYSAGDDRTVRAWDVKGVRQTEMIVAHDAQIPSLAVSPDGKLLATASRDGTARTWDALTLAPRHVLAHDDDVSAVRFGPNGRTVVTGSYDKTLKLWDSRTGNLVRTFAGHTDRVFTVAFSPDGASILSAGRDRSVRVWDVRSGAVFGTFDDGRIVSAIAFGDDPDLFASAAADGSVTFHDRRSWTIRRTLLPALGTLAYRR